MEWIEDLREHSTDVMAEKVAIGIRKNRERLGYDLNSYYGILPDRVALRPENFQAVALARGWGESIGQGTNQVDEPDVNPMSTAKKLAGCEHARRTKGLDCVLEVSGQSSKEVEDRMISLLSGKSGECFLQRGPARDNSVMRETEAKEFRVSRGNATLGGLEREAMQEEGDLDERQDRSVEDGGG